VGGIKALMGCEVAAAIEELLVSRSLLLSFGVGVGIASGSSASCSEISMPVSGGNLD
jgi:hypothetical protein